MKELRNYSALLKDSAWAAAYIAVVLMANYTALWFWPLPFFGLISTGTILFGATFTARDHAHSLGRPKVYTMIAIAGLSSAALVMFGATPYRIIIASVTAIVLSETTDTEIYQRLLSRPWLVRVAGSNLISVPMDTILFNMIGFAFVFPWAVIFSIVAGEVIAKYVVAIVVALIRTGKESGKSLPHMQKVMSV